MVSGATCPCQSLGYEGGLVVVGRAGVEQGLFCASGTAGDRRQAEGHCAV